ncbi:MAG: oxygen-independent coproporphyrinogen III oxidase [Allosphingosinicella sp.]
MKPETFAHYAGRNLPRYTSYPTAPHFSPAVDAATYGAWLQQVEPGSNLSLYLHFPFCRSMCWYCGCHTTVTARAEPLSVYLESIVSEMWLVARKLPPGCLVRHVHFGGGTPTLISPADFTQLMTALRSHFGVARDAEIAVEIDPRNLAPDLVSALAAGGVRRASLGVQTFDEVVQRAINRVQDFATVAAAVASLKLAGIHSLNFDLIYGLPFQTVQSCIETVQEALRLDPDRFAVFGYAHVPSFKAHQRKIDAATLPDARERLAQAAAIESALVAAGYVRVGLDHFAKPDDSLAIALRTGALHRNFQGYTTDDCPVLIGLGASAISRLEQGFVQNIVGIGAYQNQVRQGRLPIARGYRLSDEDRLRGALIERLMCDQKVDIASVCRAFGSDPDRFVDAPEILALEADGVIAKVGSEIRMCSESRPLVRAVAAAFDQHLGTGTVIHSRAV